LMTWQCQLEGSLLFPVIIQHAPQSQLQWWNQLVHSSGGTLNPTKCCCALYHWQPNKDGILCPSDLDPAGSLIQIDPLVPSQTIPMLALHEGTCYLGIYVTRSGATKPMEDHVWSKALLYTCAFQCTHMMQIEATVLKKPNLAFKCYHSMTEIYTEDPH